MKNLKKKKFKKGFYSLENRDRMKCKDLIKTELAITSDVQFFNRRDGISVKGHSPAEISAIEKVFKENFNLYENQIWDN